MVNGIQGVSHILNELGLIKTQTQSSQNQNKTTIGSNCENSGIGNSIHSDQLKGKVTTPVTSSHQLKRSVKSTHPSNNGGANKPAIKVNMEKVPNHHVSNVARAEISLSRRAQLLDELRNPELANSILSQKKAGDRLDRLSDVFDAFSTASRLENLGKGKRTVNNTDANRIIDGLSEIHLSIDDPVSIISKEKSRDMELFSLEVNTALHGAIDKRTNGEGGSPSTFTSTNEVMASPKQSSNASFVSGRQSHFQTHAKDGVSFRESRNNSRTKGTISFRQPVVNSQAKDTVSFRQQVVNSQAKDTVSFRQQVVNSQAKDTVSFRQPVVNSQAKDTVSFRFASDYEPPKIKKGIKKSILGKIATMVANLYQARSIAMDSPHLDKMEKNNKWFNSLRAKGKEAISIWKLLKNGGRLIIGTYMVVLDKVRHLGILKKEQDKKQTIGMMLKEKKPGFMNSFLSRDWIGSDSKESVSPMKWGLYSLFKTRGSSHFERGFGSGAGAGAGAGGGGGATSSEYKTTEGDIPQDISVLQFKEMQKEVIELSKYFRSIVCKFQVLTMILNHVTGDTKNFLAHFCTIINESITPSEPNENESTVKNKSNNQLDFSKAFQNNFLGLLEEKNQLNNLSYNVMDYYSDTKLKVIDGLSDEKKELFMEQLASSKENVSPTTFNHVHQEVTDIFSMHSKMKDYFSEKDDVVNKLQFNLTAKAA